MDTPLRKKTTLNKVGWNEKQTPDKPQPLNTTLPPPPRLCKMQEQTTPMLKEKIVRRGTV